jgi:hypothetical protein
MHVIKWIVLGIYFFGSTIFSIETSRINMFDLLALILNGLFVIGFSKLYQRFNDLGSFSSLYVLIGFAVSRVVYVGWGLRYDKYDGVKDENYLYVVTFVLIGWCVFGLFRKKRQLKSA